jgi:DNA-binding beta-propeller fold protein YncE
MTNIVHADGEGRHRAVVGVTSVDDQNLFILHNPSEQQIGVYDAKTFKLRQNLNVFNLSDHCNNGLTSCTENMRVYVNEFGKNKIRSLELTDDRKSRVWEVGRGPRGLSVNAAAHLLVSCSGEDKLQEYSPNGMLLIEISLPSAPWHAIQLTTDLYAVCVLDDVVEVDTQGRVVARYGDQLQSQTKYELSCPRHLAVDRNKNNIFVADCHSEKFFITFNRSGARFSSLNAFVGGGRQPQTCRLYFNKSIRQLYVCEAASGGRIFIFDISC